MSLEDGLIVTLLSGTKGKTKKTCPKIWVRPSDTLALKNIDIKLLKSNMGLAELPHKSKPSPGLLPWDHWHCSRQEGTCSSLIWTEIVSCLIRCILTEPRAVVEDQHSGCRTSEVLVAPFVLHRPVELQEQMAFGSSSQLGAFILPRHPEDTGTWKACQKCMDTDLALPSSRKL